MELLILSHNHRALKQLLQLGPSHSILKAMVGDKVIRVKGLSSKKRDMFISGYMSIQKSGTKIEISGNSLIMNYKRCVLARLGLKFL